MDSRFPTFRRLLGLQIPLPAWSLWPTYTTSVQRRSLLRLIAAATEENMPLSPLLEQWAQDEGGVQRRRLLKLTKLLNSGRSLADALEEVPGILQDEERLAIRFDAQSGTRTAAVRKLLDKSQSESTTRTPDFHGPLIYFGTVVLVGLAIVVFIHLRIIPVLIRIYQEFGLREPEVLRWSHQILEAVANYGWLGILAVFVLLGSLFSTRAGRFLRQAFVSRWLPAPGELFAAGVLQQLGVAAAAGRPLPGALSTLARYHFDPDMRHKLLFVRNEVEQGAEVWQSMNTVGLLTSPEVRLLKTAERVGDRPWALAQLVAVKQRRTWWRWERAAELLMPALVLLIGGLVLWQALTVILPLTHLLRGLL